ncbi:cerebellin-3-like [Dreissena polymorpha]|uniref:C1q domain-containing protein n=1 Tax=Dreissena polymorpha TaxID=45954 RepID=A0A9D4BFM7_DREPO|nr:cerebellin-3-like [Dreissena polymorpha]KAH3693670.1 hypothetical protein DPMN_081110 [Dreissena polymorpha]
MSQLAQNELNALRGAVGLRLDQQGEFRRREQEVAAIAARIANIEKMTRQFEKQTVLDGHGTEIPDGGVAFSASLSSNTHFRSGETLIFENVLLNTGSGFDSRSGEFKAPSAGIYLFSVTVRAQFHRTVSAVVEKNGGMLARLTSGYGAIERATSSMTLVAELQSDDVIRVRQAADTSGEYYGNCNTVFSGVMLD